MINEVESQHICERILERKDSKIEPVEKWEFEKLLDYHNEDGLCRVVRLFR